MKVCYSRTMKCKISFSSYSVLCCCLCNIRIHLLADVKNMQCAVENLQLCNEVEDSTESFEEIKSNQVSHAF
jgi:hypothetical protein